MIAILGLRFLDILAAGLLSFCSALIFLAGYRFGLFLDSLDDLLVGYTFVPLFEHFEDLSVDLGVDPRETKLVVDAVCKVDEKVKYEWDQHVPVKQVSKFYLSLPF